VVPCEVHSMSNPEGSFEKRISIKASYILHDDD
jgi:hypothetical protein